jgi:SOS-response transcriptional repressor LexA
MLTARETQVFEAYERAALAGHPAPTMRELAEQVGFSSAANAHRVVSQLVSKGFLHRLTYRPRAVEPNLHRSSSLARVVEAARVVAANPEDPEAVRRLRMVLAMGDDHGRR